METASLGVTVSKLDAIARRTTPAHKAPARIAETIVGEIEDREDLRSDTCALPYPRLDISMPLSESCNLGTATSNSAEDCYSYALSDNEALLSTLMREFIEVDKLS